VISGVGSKQTKQTFFKVVKDHGNIEKTVLQQARTKIKRVERRLFFILTGMHDDLTAELIFHGRWKH
jgi:hypothetical protein